MEIWFFYYRSKSCGFWCLWLNDFMIFMTCAILEIVKYAYVLINLFEKLKLKFYLFVSSSTKFLSTFWYVFWQLEMLVNHVLITLCIKNFKFPSLIWSLISILDLFNFLILSILLMKYWYFCLIHFLWSLCY